MHRIDFEPSYLAVNLLLREAHRIRNSSYFANEATSDAELDEAMHRCFFAVVAFARALGQEELAAHADSMLNEAMAHDSLNEAKLWFDEETYYLKWVERLELVLDGIRHVYAPGTAKKLEVTRASLTGVLKSLEAAITDVKCFPDPPSEESVVHVRSEMVLRCYFPDLQPKPPLQKDIKNFVPDTGLPSINTLIEYKYVTSSTVLKRVVDEILADTQGYKSEKWDNVVFVIYETGRFCTEETWRSLRDQCGISASEVQFVVLKGVPAHNGGDTPPTAIDAGEESPPA